jgi:hypothetical protein
MYKWGIWRGYRCFHYHPPHLLNSKKIQTHSKWFLSCILELFWIRWAIKKSYFKENYFYKIEFDLKWILCWFCFILCFLYIKFDNSINVNFSIQYKIYILKKNRFYLIQSVSNLSIQYKWPRSSILFYNYGVP